MGSIVAICDTKGTWTASEDRSPISSGSLLGCSLEGIVTGCSLCIAVGSEVMLELKTSKEVMLTESDVHLVSDNSSLRLCQVAVSEDITSVSPTGEVFLAIVHHNLHHRSSIIIFCRTWLILERICTTKSIINLTKLRV